MGPAYDFGDYSEIADRRIEFEAVDVEALPRLAAVGVLAEVALEMFERATRPFPSRGPGSHVVS